MPENPFIDVYGYCQNCGYGTRIEEIIRRPKDPMKFRPKAVFEKRIRYRCNLESCILSEEKVSGSYPKYEVKKEEKTKMVERKTQKEPLERFEGQVEKVEYLKTEYKDMDGNVLPESEQKNQYHVIIKPTKEEGIDYIKDSKTKRFHAYVTMSDTSTDALVAEGSVLDNYLKEIEACMPEVKKIKSVNDVMLHMQGKNFEWILKKLGRAYQGKEGRPLYVPRNLLK